MGKDLYVATYVSVVRDGLTEAQLDSLMRRLYNRSCTDRTSHITLWGDRYVNFVWDNVYYDEAMSVLDGNFESLLVGYEWMFKQIDVATAPKRLTYVSLR